MAVKKRKLKSIVPEISPTVPKQRPPLIIKKPTPFIEGEGKPMPSPKPALPVIKSPFIPKVSIKSKILPLPKPDYKFTAQKPISNSWGTLQPSVFKKKKKIF
jgi:hypothetical protein